jgi:hypothetical protein
VDNTGELPAFVCFTGARATFTEATAMPPLVAFLSRQADASEAPEVNEMHWVPGTDRGEAARSRAGILLPKLPPARV